MPTEQTAPVSRRKLGIFAAVVTIAAILIVITGIRAREEANARLREWTDDQAVPTVAVVQPDPRALSPTINLPGRMEAYSRAPIFARVSGFDEHLETGEDAEVCLRIRQAGGTLLEDSRLAVAHLDNAKTLPAFFRKERWRGLGMLGTVSWHSVDKPAAMTIAHLFAIIAAVAALVWLRTNVWARAAIVIALMFAVPAVTVVYRRRSSIASFSFLRATVLYQLYYLARINALVIIVSRMIRRRSR